MHGIISDNCKISINNNTIISGTAVVNSYNNSNILLYQNNITSGLYNVIGSQDSHITNLLSSITGNKYQSNITYGSIYNFPITIPGLDTDFQNNTLSSTFYFYKLSGMNNIFPELTNDTTAVKIRNNKRYASILINNGDSLQFDYNPTHFQIIADENPIWDNASLGIKTWIERIPKNLNNHTITIIISQKFEHETIDLNFKDFYNGSIIISGTMSILNTNNAIKNKISFENCSCEIKIYNLRFNNNNYSYSNTYNTKGYNHISNVNFINCSNVYLNNLIFDGQNYTLDEIKNDNWYNPYKYKEQSQDTNLLDSIFSYNSNLRINGIDLTNSAIGIYATVNSKVSIYGDIRYHTNLSKITFYKRQILAFATKNSIINIQTTSDYKENSKLWTYIWR